MIEDPVLKKLSRKMFSEEQIEFANFDQNDRVLPDQNSNQTLPQYYRISNMIGYANVQLSQFTSKSLKISSFPQSLQLTSREGHSFFK